MPMNIDNTNSFYYVLANIFLFNYKKINHIPGSMVRRRMVSSLPSVLHVHSSGKENTQFSMLARVCSGDSSRNGDIPLKLWIW